MWVGILVGVLWKKAGRSSKKGIGSDFNHPLRRKPRARRGGLKQNKHALGWGWDEDGSSRRPEMEHKQHGRETGGGQVRQDGRSGAMIEHPRDDGGEWKGLWGRQESEQLACQKQKTVI